MAPRPKPKPKYRPPIGSTVIACLPCEKLKATVIGHPTDDDTLLVCLDQQFPMNKLQHSYRFKQELPLYRSLNMLRQDEWRSEDT